MALYVAGAMSHADRDTFEARLLAGWPAADAELARYDAVVVGLAGPPVAPPPELKDRILAALPGPPAGFTFRFRDAGTFRPVPHAPGASVRVLHVDRPNGRFTMLMKLAPGARYPSHHHDGYEECMVLDGSLLVGSVRMTAGDYQRADADTDHVEQWSDTGATLFITAPLSLLGAAEAG